MAPPRDAPGPRRLTVPADAAGTRLDAWLADALPGTSRAAAAALVDAGVVVVDGVRRPQGSRLRGGETVVLEDERPEPAPGPALEPAVVWDGEALMVVDKPPGLVVHPAPG